MIRYLVRRVLYAIPILFGVALTTFLLFYIVISPGEMARRQLGKNPSPAQITNWLHQHNYDKPLPAQFAAHMKQLVLLDFGRSDVDDEYIWAKIKRGAPSSSLVGALIFVGLLLSSVAGALVAAYYRGTYVDHAITFVCVVMMSIVALVWMFYGQLLFGKVLKLAPLSGYRAGPLVLTFVWAPVLVGILIGLGAQIRFYRTVMLDEINQDYVRTARAKGVGEREVLFRHVLKNAFIPVITSSVLTIPFIILGNLLLESFFGIPGLGGIMVDAINGQDFAVVRAMVFLGAILYIVGTIMTDLCYALVDPRIRVE